MMMISWIEAVHDLCGGRGVSSQVALGACLVSTHMWKKPAQKSILDTSVPMWLTSFPFVILVRDLPERTMARR